MSRQPPAPFRASSRALGRTGSPALRGACTACGTALVLALALLAAGGCGVRRPARPTLGAAPAPAPAPAPFTGFGPTGGALTVAECGQEWERFERQSGARGQGVRRVLLRIRPTGYRSQERGGNAVYELQADTGQNYSGRVVGFMGEQDVVEFRIPREHSLPGAGVVQVAFAGDDLTP